MFKTFKQQCVLLHKSKHYTAYKNLYLVLQKYKLLKMVIRDYCYHDNDNKNNDTKFLN